MKKWRIEHRTLDICATSCTEYTCQKYTANIG